MLASCNWDEALRQTLVRYEIDPSVLQYGEQRFDFLRPHVARWNKLVELVKRNVALRFADNYHLPNDF
jgi:hypothetical protein